MQTKVEFKLINKCNYSYCREKSTCYRYTSVGSLVLPYMHNSVSESRCLAFYFFLLAGRSFWNGKKEEKGGGCIKAEKFER